MSRILATLCVAALACGVHAQAPPRITGVIWQLHEQAPEARGSWHRLGAHELLLQWTAVDGIAYVRGTGLRESPRMPDWQRIGRQPWAQTVIVGLSGRTDEQTARRSLDAMLAESLVIAARELPLRVAGWYFPAEIDPHWKEAPTALPAVLARLPRPLWVSAYDSDGIGAGEFAAWLASWLPGDVGVLFQDGVGVHARTPRVARQYLDALQARLGKTRVRVIAEAFREDRGKFRPATAAELRAQLAEYDGQAIYLFDGPHYVPDDLVEGLLQR